MRTLVPITLCAAAALSGCVSDVKKQSAIQAVNVAFRECYEKTLHERGTRGYAVPKSRAIEGVSRALEALGMKVTATDAVIGYVRAQAPAPAPLDAAEWKKATAFDRPMFQEIIAGEVGLLGYFIDFEPQGLDVVIRVTAVEARQGVDLSATMRMVERTPPPSGWPRREYPPCTALEVGIDKLWRAVDTQLR